MAEQKKREPNEQPKYSKDEGCPFDHNKRFTKITKDSDGTVKCDVCGAIFYNIDHSSYDLAGMFTGQYAQAPKDTFYKYGGDVSRKQSNETN